ncbi:MAG TPA: metallophosphoesterase family protein [Prolixibacteraceae bacterium]|nr:metallophosphoesterase family protein [Prolixibacteraceae bacterium]
MDKNNRLFAIGDIHGCFDAFKELIEQKIQLTPDDKLILLGDYIDRGPKSKEVIDYIIELKAKGFDITPLSGNHEQMLLDAWQVEAMVNIWMLNGGAETLKSFGIKGASSLEPYYIEFFKSLKLYAEYENYLFVHAGFNDELEHPFEDTYHMIWTCRKKYTHPLLKDKIVVHGHCTISAATCHERIQNNDRVINLDTGCVYASYKGYGRLTALELHTRNILFV